MGRAALAKPGTPWLPASPAFQRLTRIGLIVATVPIVAILLIRPEARITALLAGFALLLLDVVIGAANVERQRRGVATRLAGHRLMALGLAILFTMNAAGYFTLAALGALLQRWVYDIPLLLGLVPLAIGVVMLCWPPGTTRRDLWLIMGDTLLAGLALLVIWSVLVIPAHAQSAVTGLSVMHPWAQYVAVLSLVVVAAASRRPGALPIRQLVLLQAAGLVYVCADIIADIAGVTDPRVETSVLLLGAWSSVLLYRWFAQRPALEPETWTTVRLRAMWSVLLPTSLIVIMGVTIGAYRLLVGPVPTGAITLTLAALMIGAALVGAQRVAMALDSEATRMDRVRTSLTESARTDWFPALLSQTHDLVTVVDRSGHIVFLTPTITHLFGYEAKDLVDDHVSVLFEEVTAEELDRRLQESLHISEPDPLDLVLVDGQGDHRETETVIVPLRTDGSDGYVLTTRDVTDPRRLRAALAESGQRDPLTGLSNRDGFIARLRHVLPTQDGELAVALIDIVNFRAINDSRGHAVGDRILRHVATALDLLPPTVAVSARIGADEFALVIVDDQVEREVAHLDRLLRHQMARLVVDHGPAVNVEFCLGYVTRLPTNDSATALLERADLALAAARTTESRSAVKYERGMRSALVMRLRQEDDLRCALDDGRVAVHYQPIIDLATGRLASVEALARLHSPEGALIPPDIFIPQAEELRLIGRLGQIVLDRALADVAVINTALGRPITVAVNFSADQIDPTLPTTVRDALTRRDVRASTLTVEVTESSVVRHAHSASILAALQEMGCSIAIDDFGTGYSSLSYLVGLPVDELKIDRSFVGQLADSQRSLSLVRVLLQMANTLGLGVVAEGVETVEQADLLRGMGCRWAQGYLYAAPMPLPDLLELINGPSEVFRSVR